MLLKLKIIKFNCDKLFLYTQSNNILPLLENSDSIIQNNWLSIDICVNGVMKHFI